MKKCCGYNVGIRFRERRGDQIRNFDQMIEVGFTAFAPVVCVFFGGVMGGGKDRLDFVVHFSGYTNRKLIARRTDSILTTSERS